MKKPSTPNIWDIRRSALAQLSALRNRKNISHITVGYKQKDGMDTGEKALIFYVSEKSAVSSSDRVPPLLDVLDVDHKLIGAVSTDVQQASAPKTFGWRSGHLIKSFDNDIGVCAVTFSKNNQHYLLTNAHVVIDVSRNGLGGPPSIFNRTDGRYYQVGNIIKATELRPGVTTNSDLAIVAIPPGHVVDDYLILDLNNNIDAFEGIETLAPHQYWYVVNGQVHACAKPERIVGSAPINVDGALVNYTEFWQLRMTAGEARPGHSGALLCRTVGNQIRACGLIFGGLAPTHVFAFPFNKMWRLVESVLP